jgi:hypothetical protein
VRRVGRLLCGAVVLSVAAASLSACGSSSGPSSIAVTPAVTIVVPAGASFTPSATSASQSASSLLVPVVLGHSVTGPSPFATMIAPVHLKWTGTFPKQGVELHFHVKASSIPSGATPFVATYDPATNTWHPVASTFDATTGLVSAHADHFSIWGVFDFFKSALKALVKDIYDSLVGAIKVTEPAPVCTNPAGVNAVASPADGILDVCAQNNGGTSVTLKVRSHLAFPVDVIPPVGTQIAVSPPGGIFEKIGGYLNKAGTGESTRTLVVAGSEADLTFPIPADHYQIVLSDLDTEAYLASIIDSAVSVLTVIYGRLGGNPKDALSAIGQGTCLTKAAQAIDKNSPVSLATAAALTHVAIDCADAVIDLGTIGVAQGVIATVAGLIENVMQTGFFGAMIIVGGISGGRSTITVSRAAVNVSSEVEVPLEVCPTTGYSNSKAQPATMRTFLPVTLRGMMTAYESSFTSGLVLAPSGWNCSADVGGDGGTIVRVSNPDDPSEQVTSIQEFGVGPMFWLACPFLSPFPYPQWAYLQGPCPQSIPSYESQVRVNKAEAKFTIPAGDGNLSSSVGGLKLDSFPIEGVMVYEPPSSGSGSGIVSCELPQSKEGICSAIVAAYLAWYM